jgi:Tfp pilus tip-associated adhesin PilY1
LKNKFLIFFVINFSGLITFYAPLAVEISDLPLISSIIKPPAHIMFVVDNSGSMNWETMMEGTAEGLFRPDSDLIEYGYIFVTGSVFDTPKITGLAKRYIKPRCTAFNKIYYNPKFEYIPWPGTKNYKFHNADMRYPKLVKFSDKAENFGDIFKTSKEVDLFARYLTITNGKFNITGDNEDKGTKLSPGWSMEKYFSAYKSCFHATSKSGAYMEIPLELPCEGTYSLIAYWPLVFGDDSSGKAEYEIKLYESGINISNGVILKNQKNNAGGEFGIDSGLGDKNGNLGEFTINSEDLNPHGPDVKVIIRHPGEDSSYYIKADRFEAFYQYGADSDFADINDFVVKISNAHYFTWDDKNGNKTFDKEESLYLVNFILDDSGEEFFWKTDNSDLEIKGRVARQYFKVSEKSGFLKKDFYLDDEGILGKGELIPVSDLPHNAKRYKYSDKDGSCVYMTAKEDLQNFANWFEFYRTRLLAAKSAMARTIADISDVVVGIYTINPSIREPGLGVKTYMPSTYIADDDDMDEGAYLEEGGGINQWRDSYSAVSYNKSSRTTNKKINYSDYTAKWKIKDIKEPGTYKVYVRWTRYAGIGGGIVDRDPKAKYFVYCVNSSGEKKLVKSLEVNQNKGTKNPWGEEMLPDFWNRICDVTIEKGDEIHVELKRGTNSWFEYTSADAVKAVNTNASQDVDNTCELLDLIYKIEAKGSTPLRHGLNNVGKYFSTIENPSLDSELGNISPFSQDGGECLQSFAVIMTDGYWNDKDFFVKDYDNDGVSATLADVAAKYYKDLAPETEDLVPVNNCDISSRQHLVDYAIAFGASGTLNPADFEHCGLADKETGIPAWPKGPVSGWTKEKTDDLFHACVNSRGAFYNASDPRSLFDSLTAIIKDIEIRYNSGAGVSVNSYKIKSDLRLYQSFYSTRGWSGWLKAFKLEKDSSSALVIDDENNDGKPDVLWNTNDFMAHGSFLPAARKILIKDKNGPAVEFYYENLSKSLKSVFDPNVLSSEISVKKAAEENVEKTVDYLRGESVPGFRKRQTALGDIIHSSPVKWGKTVYAGANDGMLHGFDESSGKERFGFIPSFVLENLSCLTKHDYTHKYFVDHSPVIERISKSSKELRKTEDILVCGLGKGGKGYFALNLKNENIDADQITMTSSENLSELFKWEFPKNDTNPKDIADMGFSFSRPVIVKSNIKSHPYIVVFGNGYNSINQDSGIFILDAFTGELITKIMTNSPGDNGMSTPAVVDSDNNSTGDFVFCGDLKGNLWKFDISKKVSSKIEAKNNWGCFYKSVSDEPRPLFTARFSNQIQPITTKPDIAKHKYYHGYIVVFGTGKFLGKNDMDDLSRQTVYGIWDFGDQKDEFIGTISRPDVFSPDSKTYITNIADVYLLNQSIDYKSSFSGVSADSAFSDLEILSDNKLIWKLKKISGKEVFLDLDKGSYAGWYFDLPEMGERIVQDPKVVAGKAVFNSYVPQSALQMCTSGGYSWFHEINVQDGSRLDSPSFDINSDKEIMFNETPDEGDEILNDVIKINDEGSIKYYPPSRVKIEGMAFSPVIVTSKKKEGKILGTSQDNFKIIDEKRQRIGIFYWRKR